MRVAVALLMLLLAGCSPPTPDTPTPPEVVPPAIAGHIRFLALGDSYTIGEGVAPTDRFPVRVAAMLRATGVDIADPAILARTGWTTADLRAALDRNRDALSHYDVVTLLIGVNNQYHGLDRDDFKADLRILLRSAADLAGGRVSRVVVVSIPDWGATPYGRMSGRRLTSAEIDAYNADARALATGWGAAWVDITDLSRDPTSAVTDDGLHPAAAQYVAWAGRIAQAVRSIAAARN